MRWPWLAALLSTFSTAAAARPVTVPDGTAVAADARVSETSASAAYALDRRVAVGAWAGQYRGIAASAGGGGDEITTAAPVIGLLPLRLNGDGSQVNLYVTAGYGATRSREGDTTHPSALAIVDADAETRRLYASARYERTFARDTPRPLAYTRVRAGGAPFLGQMLTLQAWMLVQWDYDAWRRVASVTPLARFMYQNTLWEIGVSTRGEAQFNWALEL